MGGKSTKPVVEAADVVKSRQLSNDPLQYGRCCSCRL